MAESQSLLSADSLAGDSLAPAQQEEAEEFFVSVEGQLLEQRASVLRGAAPHWEGFKDTYLSHESQLDLIMQYDEGEEEERALIFDESGQQVAQVLLQLLAQVKQPQVVKYLLVLCDELLEGAPVLQDQRARVFLSLAGGEDGLPAAPFISLLDFQDPFIRYMSGKLASLFVWKMRGGARERDINALVRWVVEQLQQRANPYSTRCGVKALQYSLQNPAVRPLFFAASGLDQLAPVLAHQYQAILDIKKGLDSSGRDLQLVYETIFCIWLLSFEEEIAEGVASTRIVYWIVKLCQELDSEKIRRISLAALRNLSGKAENDEQMIYAGFPIILKTLLSKRWGDEDITNDLDFLANVVEQKMLDMTTFDRYRQEILSGELEWSPVHKSERFWKENVTRLSEKNYELVGVLTTLLESAKAETQAIACHDLGEFARFHPRGKKVIHDHDIKRKIMELIDSEDEQVQQQSLLAIQKVMIHNWRHVS